MAVALALDATCRVTLIGAADNYYDNRGAVRAVVEGSKFATRLTSSYSRLLKNGKFVQADVVSIGGERAVIRRPGASSTEELSFDFGVVALGSSYAAPFKAVSRSTADTVAALDMIYTALRKAQTVVVVGGGPVGVELAAELRTDFPALDVTLIHSGARLLSGRSNHSLVRAHPLEFADAAERKLRELGVTLVLGQKAALPPDLDRGSSRGFVLEPTTVRTEAGSYSVDVMLIATGARPNTAPLKQYLASCLNEAGEVRVGPTLNIDGHPTLFAIGDVAATGDAKLASVVGAQAAHVASVIRARLAGKRTPLYSLAPSPMYVSLGRARGVGLLANGWVVGDWAVRTAKGRDMYAGAARKAMHG